MTHVSVRFFTGQITVCEQPVILADKEAHLLFTIAAAEHNIHIERILDQLWPDADGDAAHNCFRVCLYRLRKHLNSGPLVSHRSHNYAVCDDVYVDLRAMRAALCRPNAGATDLEPFFQGILDGRAARRGLGGWFYPYEEIVAGYLHKCGHVLAREALRSQCFPRAAYFAQTMLQYAPDDLSAMEILEQCAAMI